MRAITFIIIIIFLYKRELKNLYIMTMVLLE